jgi:hypothetical protein
MTHNWVKAGWRHSHAGAEFGGKVIVDGPQTIGDDPGFVDFAAQDFHLAAGSPCINAGTELAPEAIGRHDVLLQYVKHRRVELRPTDERIDLGAYELAEDQ